jgi:hypothetical protein
VAQIPEIDADHDVGHDLEGERRFLVPPANGGARRRRLVEQVEGQKQAVLISSASASSLVSTQ